MAVSFDTICKDEGGVRACLEWIGEGLVEDYDPEDVNDVPLARFTLYTQVDGQWEQVEDGSWCTLIDVRNLTPEVSERILNQILASTVYRILAGTSIKKACADLSCIQE